ncbi:MAG: hypothetical protein VX222_04975, partial [Actinomycetota bacterium]|nr:hypothetical protein [Actinomycetota bacterium]
MTARSPARVVGPALTQRVTSWILKRSAALLRGVAAGRIESALGVTVGAVWLSITPLFFLCAAVDLVDGGPDADALLV